MESAKIACIDDLVKEHPLIKKRIQLLARQTEIQQQLHRTRKTLDVLSETSYLLAGNAPLVPPAPSKPSTAKTKDQLMLELGKDHPYFLVT